MEWGYGMSEICKVILVFSFCISAIVGFVYANGSAYYIPPTYLEIEQGDGPRYNRESSWGKALWLLSEVKEEVGDFFCATSMVFLTLFCSYLLISGLYIVTNNGISEEVTESREICVNILESGSIETVNDSFYRYYYKGEGEYIETSIPISSVKVLSSSRDCLVKEYTLTTYPDWVFCNQRVSNEEFTFYITG